MTQAVAHQNTKAGPLAEISGLTIHYGKRVAVDGLSFALDAGEIVLLLGPNGAGKSTTLSAIAGAIVPSGGRIAIDGEDMATAPRSARAKVGFADQPPALYEFFTVLEHVGFVAEARGADTAAAEEILGQLGLSKIAKRPCRELSFGMRQRVGLAAALVGPVEVALLDETLNGLDPHASRAARATLRAAADRGAAVLMSTHLLGVAERMCDRILIMDKGKLVADRRDAELKELLDKGPSAVEDLYVSLIADEGPT
ncbi:MAG: ABC transporter ATP-binding protein [Deltaproteobacteria bacterium]|nr:ABC transporter ATP-binding protein [Deltaproteobacteria bacterium]MCW5805157.1 ABC transporter ATP-binding protein [Deltaproteobacteria bacterium]